MTPEHGLLPQTEPAQATSIFSQARASMLRLISFLCMPTWLVCILVALVLFPRVLSAVVCVVVRVCCRAIGAAVGTILKQIAAEAFRNSSKLAGFVNQLEDTMILIVESILFDRQEVEVLFAAPSPTPEAAANQERTPSCAPCPEPPQWPAFFRGVEVTIVGFALKALYWTGRVGGHHATLPTTNLGPQIGLGPQVNQGLG